MNNNSFDINVRTLDFHNRKIEIHYVSSLCSDELIAYLVEGITNAKGKTLKDCLNNGDVKEETEISLQLCQQAQIFPTKLCAPLMTETVYTR